MNWKKKSKLERLNRPLDFDRACQFMKGFSLFVKQCYRIIFLRVEKNPEIKNTEKI